MKEVEQYYNERIKQKGDLEFNELTELEVDSIEKSTAFAFWRLDKAWNDIAESIKKAFVRLTLKQK